MDGAYRPALAIGAQRAARHCIVSASKAGQRVSQSALLEAERTTANTKNFPESLARAAILYA